MNKRRLDSEDIFGLVEFLDKRQLLTSLPTFYAADLGRIPRMAPTDVDSVRLAETVGDLRQQVRTLTSQVEELKNLVMMSKTKTGDGATGVIGDTAPVAATSLGDESTTASFAAMMNSTENRSQWFAGSNNKTRVQSQRKIVGKANASSGSGRLKAVSNEGKSWHVFVGRLQPTTTADELSDFVRDVGIDVIECSMLSKREKWQEKYAAFRLVVDYKHKDKVFDDVMWPEG